MKERAYAFHQWSVADVERHFNVDSKSGLSQRRASFRLAERGENSLNRLKESSIWTIVWRQFSNLFIWLLIAAGTISYFVDGLLQALILLLIIIINVSLGFYQEYKAEKSLSELKVSFKARSKVIRDGKIHTLPNEGLVIGDVVILEVGDRVPADIRLIEGESLKTDESALTGESMPQEKTDEVLDIDIPVADRTNMLYSSTVVVSGRGKGIVTATAEETEFGKIAELIEKADDVTPLEKRIVYIGKVLTYASLVIAVIIFSLGFIRDYEVLPLLTFTIAIFIAAVPESLPTVITLSLAIGVSRMAQKKAITRRLSAVEELGTVNIIATDKTGTLTNDILSVGQVVLRSNKKLTNYNIDEEASNHSDDLIDLFLEAVVCSNLNIHKNGEFLGDPLEVAIAEKAKSMQRAIITKSSHYNRISEIPFNSQNKFMSVVVEKNGEKLLIAKGSVEKIITFCDLTKKEKAEIVKKATLLSKEGFRVIALADKKVTGKNGSGLFAMKLVGLFALIDEPSEGISEAIEKTIAAGIRPIMITGDHPETARFVADKVGLNVSDDEIILGQDLNNLNQRELKKALTKVKIFARVSPEDKIMIVKTLQKLGFSVAVTGDGVNDAPALKEASVGIAMGIKGTDVARDSSDIILSDDKFGTIVSAVAYGRAIYDNILNAITFLLSANFGELYLIAFAFIFDLPVPLLTLQILWINLVTDSLPAIALAFEKPSAKILNEKPRVSTNKPFRRSIIYSVYLSIIILILGSLLYMRGLDTSIEKARTLVFTFAVFSELLFCLSIRSKERIWQKPLNFFSNKFLLYSIAIISALQIALFSKPFAKIFSLVSLNLRDIMLLVGMLALSFLFAEIVRHKLGEKS